MTTEYARYARGGTSWLGYLASTGKQDRSEGRQDRLASHPDSSYWQRQAETASVQCQDLISDATWDRLMDLLPDFAERSWLWQAQGFRALYDAVSANRNLTAEQMEIVFLAGN